MIERQSAGDGRASDRSLPLLVGRVGVWRGRVGDSEKPSLSLTRGF
jgi:hypothetical protein